MNKSDKFSIDLLYNYSSLIILAAGGFLINIIITAGYGTSILGIFNLIYAFYIILSQLCTLGIHYSALRHLACQQHDSTKINHIISSALLVAALFGTLIACALILLHNQLAHLFASPLLGQSLALVAPAIVLFALNKILLASLNGLRSMRAYAIYQAIRYILMIGFILLVTLFKFKPIMLSLNYFAAELILLILLALHFYRKQYLISFSPKKDWCKKHLNFGVKGFMSGMLIELNSRIDIIILGLFVSKSVVGVYSFAALFAEGVYQFTIVMKNNINPLLARYLTDKNFDDLYQLIKKTKKLNMLIISVLIGALIILYPLFVKLIFNNEPALFIQGWPVIIIFSLGLFASARFLPFDNLFTQSGQPGLQTTYGSITVLSNIVLNFLLVPTWGYIGCAVATMFASYIIPVFTMSFFSKKYTGVNLLRP